MALTLRFDIRRHFARHDGRGVRVLRQVSDCVGVGLCRHETFPLDARLAPPIQIPMVPPAG